MGVCCSKCRTRADRRKYLRTRYNVEREMSLEFENLMEEDSCEITMPQYGAVLTDEEKKFISERKFQDLVRYQKKVDAELEAKLEEQEENLRLEEESFIEAKREAARVAKRLREQELKKPAINKSQQMSNEEDFEEFLDSVRKRSLNTKPGTSSALFSATTDTWAGSGLSKSSQEWSADFGLSDSEEEEFVSAAVLPTSKKTVPTAVLPASTKSVSSPDVSGNSVDKLSPSSSEAER